MTFKKRRVYEKARHEVNSRRRSCRLRRRSAGFRHLYDISCARSATLMLGASIVVPHPQRRDERLLRDAHVAVLAHPRLALLLLLEKLAFAGRVAAVAFCGHV